MHVSESDSSAWQSRRIGNHSAGDHPSSAQRLAEDVIGTTTQPSLQQHHSQPPNLHLPPLLSTQSDSLLYYLPTDIELPNPTGPQRFTRGELIWPVDRMAYETRV